MTQLTDHQIAEHVVGGGFVGENRVIGVAVVLAESGGRTDILGDVDLRDATFGPSVGLFQIRSLKAQKGTGGTRDELANLDPATNAHHAHVVFMEAGGNWTPWSTFKRHEHETFLDRARTAVAAIEEDFDMATGDQILDAIHELRGKIGDLRQDLTVVGTPGLPKTVADFASRQRDALKKLDDLNARLTKVEQHLGIQP
jgi:Lysozyme like domain